jgi:hypothetical protein
MSFIFLLLSTIQYTQTIIYISDPILNSTLFIWLLLMAVYILGGFLEGYFGIMMESYTGVSWIVYAALGKALSTLLKYFMQARHNYMRKCVSGVSPLSCAVDLTGAIFALI